MWRSLRCAAFSNPNANRTTRRRRGSRDKARSALDRRRRRFARAAQNSVRAIDRVDDPTAVEWSREIRRGFFTKESIIGKRRGELATEEIFNLAIGNADKIARTFELDDELVAPIPKIKRERAGPSRGRAGKHIPIVHDGMDSAPKGRIGSLTSRNCDRSCKDCNGRVHTWERRRDACRYRSFTVHRKCASEGCGARRRRRKVSMLRK